MGVATAAIPLALLSTREPLPLVPEVERMARTQFG